MQNFVDACIIIHQSFSFLHFFGKLIQDLRINTEVDSMLAIHPMCQEMFKIFEKLFHLQFVYFHIRIQKLLHTVGAEIQEHRDLFKLVDVGGLVYMDNIRKSL